MDRSSTTSRDREETRGKEADTSVGKAAPLAACGQTDADGSGTSPGAHSPGCRTAAGACTCWIADGSAQAHAAAGSYGCTAETHAALTNRRSKWQH